MGCVPGDIDEQKKDRESKRERKKEKAKRLTHSTESFRNGASNPEQHYSHHSLNWNDPALPPSKCCVQLISRRFR